MEGDVNLWDIELPESLPRLDRGAHRDGDGHVCAMEAAAWLDGEPWSDNPRSVHRVIRDVARTVNDRVGDDVRQTLWPLILASLDTARPRHPVLKMRLSLCAGKALAKADGNGDLPEAWRTVLNEHARLYGKHWSPGSSANRLRSLTSHLKTR
jgi:hypothetical protein